MYKNHVNILFELKASNFRRTNGTNDFDDELINKCFRVLKRRGQSWGNSCVSLTRDRVGLSLTSIVCSKNYWVFFVWKIGKPMLMYLFKHNDFRLHLWMIHCILIKILAKFRKLRQHLILYVCHWETKVRINLLQISTMNFNQRKWTKIIPQELNLTYKILKESGNIIKSSWFLLLVE